MTNWNKYKKEFEKKFAYNDYFGSLVTEGDPLDIWNWIDHALTEARKEERENCKMVLRRLKITVNPKFILKGQTGLKDKLIEDEIFERG